ncbi:MAG: site-2 protease family protein [Pirellulales bacterium]|nr:site-2 protease family protein [Pirellulales bacterium]
MFRGSWKIARIAGIDVFIHWSFGLILVYVAVMRLMEGGTAAEALQHVSLVLATFVCVVMHEYGHALTARVFGIRTREITLLPIGGVARLEKMPDDPKQELLVALAGPAVNVVIVIILGGTLVGIAGMASVKDIQLVSQNISGFLGQLMAINIFLVVFNLIPAFPMDGGRVLRAFLAMWMDYAQATNIASVIGRIAAVGFAGAAIAFGSPVLFLIAIFVYLGAQQETQIVRTRVLLEKATVQAAMATSFATLSPLTRLSDVARQFVPGGQQDFPVVDGEQLVGMLFGPQLISAVQQGLQDQNVGSIMATGCPALDEHAPLQQTLTQMQESGYPALPVVRDDQLVGLVTLQNIGQWMMFESARRQARGGQQPMEDGKG